MPTAHTGPSVPTHSSIFNICLPPRCQHYTMLVLARASSTLAAHSGTTAGGLVESRLCGGAVGRSEAHFCWDLLHRTLPRTTAPHGFTPTCGLGTPVPLGRSLTIGSTVCARSTELPPLPHWVGSTGSFSCQVLPCPTAPCGTPAVSGLETSHNTLSTVSTAHTFAYPSFTRVPLPTVPPLPSQLPVLPYS